MHCSFWRKKVYFEAYWEEIVTSKEGCIKASKEGRVLTPDDLVDGVPASSSTKNVSAASEEEVKKLLHVNDENDENSLESSIDDDNVKVKNVTLNPSTSQDTDKLERNTLFDKIGELFEIKMKFMTSEMRSDIANNAKEIKSDMTNLISDMTNKI